MRPPHTQNARVAAGVILLGTMLLAPGAPSGASGAQYELKLWNPSQIQRVEGADLKKNPDSSSIILQIPNSGSEQYLHAKVVLQFADVKNKGKR